MLKLLAAFLLVFLNAVFVAAEFSFVRIRSTRLEELSQQGNKEAFLLLRMVGELDAYLSATQLGITASSLALGWMGEPAIASLLSPFINVYLSFLPNWFVSPLAFALSFLVVTFFQIVLGELVPRTIAINKVELIALNTAKPIYVFYKLIYPLVFFFNKSARAILHLFSFSLNNETEKHTEEELRMIIDVSEREGVIDSMESKLIDNVLDFADWMAREVMVPRQDIVCLYEEDSFEENLETVRASIHTRYPLCRGDKDHIVGMVHIRGILNLLFKEPAQRNIAEIANEIIVIPEGMSVAEVFRLLQEKHMQMAVIADEYGGTAGIVTVEDLVEKIVGDLQDEYDQEEAEIIENTDGSYDFDGMLHIDTIEELLAIELPEHDEDTLGGYIFGVLGRRPEVGDKIETNGYIFEVRKIKGFRIQRVKADKVTEAQDMDEQ